MKKKHLLFFIVCMIIPTLVFAESSDGDLQTVFLIYPPFISLFHYFFIITPIIALAKINELDFSKGIKVYAVLVFINFLLINLFGLTWLVISFLAVFVIGFPLMIFSPFLDKFSKGKVPVVTNIDPSKVISGSSDNGVDLKCAKCFNDIKVEDKFCPHCGEEIKGNNITVKEGKKSELVNSSDFAAMYLKPEGIIIHDIIFQESKNIGLDLNSKLIPKSEVKRFIGLDIIFSILVFLFIGLIFYHVSYFIYLIGLIILVIFFIKKDKFDLMAYLMKEVKARPNENIDNVIGSVKENLVEKKLIITKYVLPVIVILGGLFIFRNPIIFYEPLDDGYAVRFYFTGLSSIRTATIPEEHNGKKVISLRGNSFSNLPLLKEVYLPDSITEIRGEAFLNDYSLVKVHLPKNLKTLGGDSFRNCWNLRYVNLEYDTPLTEIRGNTFEECHSLESITIPDSVTRIGGHAFYNNYNLVSVNISENSSLNSIGSSAFRLCKKLKTVSLPSSASIDSKTFKESPTVVKYFKSAKEEANLIETVTIDFNDYKTIYLKDDSPLYMKIDYYDYNSSYDTHYVRIGGSFSGLFSFKTGDEHIQHYEYYYLKVFANSDSSITVSLYKKNNNDSI